ncbi:hypothetical protein BDF14DRAFT_1724346 [Spinellus fusiger]|nr:hypothetical protein BDF14DRAFT_1724346 [Spinellus fusiger]
MSWKEERESECFSQNFVSQELTCSSPSTEQHIEQLSELTNLSFSYTDSGVRMEAQLNNISDFHTLINTFGKMCCSPTEVSDTYSNQSVILKQNSNTKSKPINKFAVTYHLGEQTDPHSNHDDEDSLQIIADACVDTYFSCRLRYLPVLNREAFISWYRSEPMALDSLIVNAICSHTFRHMVTHHLPPALKKFNYSQDMIKEQTEYFFRRSRECLSQSFDHPDRYSILALVLMGAFTEASKRHHYAGMSVSALQALNIYPRMVGEVEEDEEKAFELEMDTRLWWAVWSNNFYLYSSGVPRIIPQTRIPGEVDLPQVMEQDIDGQELCILAQNTCYKLWQIQYDLLVALAEQDNKLKMEELDIFTSRTQAFYDQLPIYFKLDSGFEYGSEDFLLTCLRVNIEYNATLIVLHQMFIPDANDLFPTDISLWSLKSCLIAAIQQVKTMNSYRYVTNGACMFDRNELWRAAEILTLAASVSNVCQSESRTILFSGINEIDYINGLASSLEILQDTREYKTSNKNWLQMSEWLQKEIIKHNFPETPTAPTKYNRQSTLRQSITRQPRQKQAKILPCAPINPVSSNFSPSSPSVYLSSFQGTQIHFQNQFSAPSKPSTSESTSKSSVSNPPSFVPFSYIPQQEAQRHSGKGQTRFRYFNPPKMNKLLFIDEHPMT